jgi:hypothetical protein
MARKKEVVKQVDVEKQVKLVDYSFQPDLLTINARELAYIWYVAGLRCRPEYVERMGNLKRHFRPNYETVDENIQQETEGPQAPTTSP